VATLSDIIESHLKKLLAMTGDEIEIRRCDVAQQFDCVPSQINYVLETRFTPQRGYVVESRRGGGGYIRITRYVMHGHNSLEAIFREIGSRITEEKADSLLLRLVDGGMLMRRTAALIRAALKDETDGLDPSVEPIVRARLLRAMLRIAKQT